MALQLSYIVTSMAVVFVSAVLSQNATTESVTKATCPRDVFKRVQGCFKQWGILSAALTTVLNPTNIPSFCGIADARLLLPLQSLKASGERIADARLLLLLHSKRLDDTRDFYWYTGSPLFYDLEHYFARKIGLNKKAGVFVLRLERQTIACLQDNLELCADDPSRLALLKLQVDPDRSYDNLRYFCSNKHVLRAEVNCTNYDEVSACTQRVGAKLRESLVESKEFKPVMDKQCLYNDDLLQCLTGSMGDNCNGTRQLYVHLLDALRFPYCDLKELDQHVKLHEALNPPELSQRGAGSGGSGSTKVADTGSGSDSAMFLLQGGHVIVLLFCWVLLALQVY